MMKTTFVLLLIFQFNCVFGQKTLEQIIEEIPLQGYDYSAFFNSYDNGKTQGISIQHEPQILEKLRLEPLEYGEYYISSKYEINNSLVLFISKYWETEDAHFAILLDKSFNIIDRLDETAYDNTEGFYGVTTNLDFNIITTTIHNSYNTPKYVTKRHTITDEGFEVIKDQVVVRTPSGILIREEPTIASTIVGSAADSATFNFLSRGYELDSTAAIEKGKFLKDYWLGVSENGSFTQLGYVFGAFTKRRISLITNDYHVIVNEISKEDFFSEEIRKRSKPVVEKITDIDEITRVLGKQLTGENNDEDGYYKIEKLRSDNGKEINEYWDDYGIIAYFPKYHYLLLEGGHSSENIINLKTGDNDIDRIGNPDYYLSSPQNTFRLNGYYNGQSFVHFLEQNNENGVPEYLFSFSSLLALDFIEEYFWKDDTTFFAKIENSYYSVEMRIR